MNDWNDLLDLLASGARENGTPALAATMAELATRLRQLGLEVDSISYLAHPWRLRLAGILTLLGALLFSWLLRRRAAAAALVVAVALPAAILADLDFYVPVFGWMGAVSQQHVEATIPVAAAKRHLIFAAHVDSKTDLLDHLERVPIELLALPVALAMIVAAGVMLAAQRRGVDGRLQRHSRGWLTRAAIWLAPIYGIGTFLSLSGGMLVEERSPGALDDGAACAVLVRLAERLRLAPPQSTRVSVLLLSGEEIGVHGSWVYAQDRFGAEPALPTTVINLEFLGAAADLGVFASETFSLKKYPADPGLLALVDAVHHQQRGKPIYRPWYGAATDARSFLAHGIPALTLFSDPPGHPFPRDLHSAADTRDRIDASALDASLAFLEAIVRRVDVAAPADLSTRLSVAAPSLPSRQLPDEEPKDQQ